MKITALAGGVGASKLLLGLARSMDPRDLTVIVNTGDDIVLHGLYICPDLDIVTYTLAGSVNPQTGWGLAGDTFHTLKALARYSRKQWFNLGDRDLATHIHRTALLAGGKKLAEIADSIRRDWGVASTILPATEHPIPTTIVTDAGEMHFQEYLVKHRAEPPILDIRFEGIESSAPAPGVLEALRGADGILICPSNPLISIGPILAVPGVRETMWSRRERSIAVSPLVGGKSLKGPSDKMLAECLVDPTSCGVAMLYEDVASVMVLDPSDSGLCPDVVKQGVRPVLLPSVMHTEADKDRLARGVLALFREIAANAAGA
ncbi:MAG TPA: 2-phospho-L-lactate transferase [Candidatus Acidoferrales bacterium]|nr:2-phospho-L-lactate transferase [Candidatus Acidoferrales bacterium]